jgi:hypothetical protein
MERQSSQFIVKTIELQQHQFLNDRKAIRLAVKIEQIFFPDQHQSIFF